MVFSRCHVVFVTRRWRDFCSPARLLTCLLLLVVFNAVAASAKPALLTLNKSSQQLITRLQQHKASAVAFRTDVVFYRESLRKLMLKNEKAGDYAIDRQLLMQMVRMAALLQSAAECHTGRYISCPAGLMHELTQQQKQINRAMVPYVHAKP